MKIKTLLSFLFFLMSFGLFTQEKEPEEKIQWSANLLTWDDFKGKEDKSISDEYKAATESGFSYSWSVRSSAEGLELAYSVKSNFYPRQSWVRKGAKTERLLNHEQLHFDISELHARKLNKIMSEYETPSDMEELKRDLSRMYSQIEKQRLEMQDLYDEETNNGTLTEEQKKWDQKIKAALKKLADFGN